jgi:Protein of unknown function (DUF1579)
MRSGPEYKILDAWAGRWVIQGEAKDALSGPAHRVYWTLNGRRILGGFFLQIQTMWKAQGTVQNGLVVTGFDPTKKVCTTHGYNDEGSWLISTLVFISERTCLETGSTFYPDGRVLQYRMTWNFGPDGNSLSVTGENEKDGTWGTSFEGKGVRGPEKVKSRGSL